MSGISRYVAYRKHLARLMSASFHGKPETLYSGTRQKHQSRCYSCKCTTQQKRKFHLSSAASHVNVATPIYGAQSLLPRTSIVLSPGSSIDPLVWHRRPHISPLKAPLGSPLFQPHVSSLLHTSSKKSEPGDGESKVEQAVKAIQEKKKTVPESEPPQVMVAKKSLVVRFKDEIVHYWNGFRLLWVEMKIAGRMLLQVLNGRTLTRREYKQFTRTVADLFRMVPFMVFIIIPFMEFLLPFALYLFPALLPSTFETRSKKAARLTKELKVKLEMAKFLQDTVEETALQGAKSNNKESATQFADFLENIRTSGLQASNKEILKYSKLFEDELTLDNLNRGQLIALCRLLRLQPIGTNNFLRFQLKMQLRSLMADDKMIFKEGVDTLDVQELQAACQARGMRAIGVPVDRLQSQLQQWLDLHLDEQIPTSLLLLSRALYLPENLTTSDALQATIASLPEETSAEAKLKLAEMEGEKVDNTERLKVIKKEEEIIKQEKKEKQEIEKQEQEKKAAAAESELMKEKVEEELVDKAPILETPPVKEVEKEVKEEDLEVSNAELKDISEVISKIADEKEALAQEKEDLEELKQDVEDYKEDLEDLKKEQEEDADLKLSETKSSLRMSKQVEKIMGRMDSIVSELETAKHSLVEKRDSLHDEDTSGVEEFQQKIDSNKKTIIRVEELVEAMKKLDKVEDEEKFQRIFAAFDEDKDGIIETSEVLNVIAAISREDVALNTKQIGEVMDLLSKEDILEELEKDVESHSGEEIKEKK